MTPQDSFTDEQIQSFKRASAKDHDGRVMRIDIDEPVECSLVVAPFNRAEFAAHVDARARDRQTSFVGALFGQLLYPSLAEAEAMRQDWATLPGKVASELLKEAGDTNEPPVFKRLDVKAPPTGLDPDKAAELGKAHEGARLWAVEIPAHNLSVVMRAPISDMWLAAKAADGDARAKAEKILYATEPYVLGSVVWQSAPLIGGSGVLDRKPALYWDLLTAYWLMGGDGAAVRRKSL